MKILCKKRLALVTLCMISLEIIGSQDDSSICSPQKIVQAQYEEDLFFKELDDACAESCFGMQDYLQQAAEARKVAHEQELQYAQYLLAQKKAEQVGAQRQFEAFQQAWVDQGAIEFEKILVRKCFTKKEEKVSELLCGAALDGKTRIVQGILKGKFGSRVINSPYMNSTTNPLLAAAGNGHLDIVVCLIAHGADTAYRNSKGQDFLDVARSNHKRHVVEHFEK